MKRVKHWQDPANALLGAWLIVSPWVLGYQDVIVAAVSTAALGALLIASSIEAMQVAQAWEEWLDVALGVVLMLLPGVLGFDGHPAALQNALLTGGAVIALALWVLATDDEFVSGWGGQAG
jgi:hypothetical protein